MRRHRSKVFLSKQDTSYSDDENNVLSHVSTFWNKFMIVMCIITSSAAANMELTFSLLKERNMEKLGLKA